MKDLLNKMTARVAGFALFCMACVMAGIGIWVVMVLALFALAAAGIGMLAAPLIVVAHNPSETEDEQVAAA